MLRVRPAIALFVVMCSILLVFGIRDLAASVRFGRVMQLARHLETGTPVSRGTVTGLAGVADEVVSGGHCRADIVRAGLTVKLAELDQRNSYHDYDAWAGALAAAENYLRHAIGCRPTDGNLWLRFAMVRRAVAEQLTEIAFLMQQSVYYAPAEQGVLVGRFAVWNDAAATTLEAARSAVETDLATVLRHGELPLIRQILQKPGERLQPLVDAAVSSLSTERRAVLAGAKIGS
ncbi:MAG: hypothetical protein LDL42_09935 [Rhizobium sp.]|nr:hypothetical protein [Rhizobium sp.]